MAQPNPESIAQEFINYYYNLFGTNRAQLGVLYSEQSIMTFEGERYIGQPAIVAKFAKLPFSQARVQVVTQDCQPSLAGGILIFVTGNILPEGESNPLKFSQVFHLMSSGNSFYASNDMFRLNYT